MKIEIIITILLTSLFFIILIILFYYGLFGWIWYEYDLAKDKYLKYRGWKDWTLNKPSENMNIRLKFDDNSSCFAYYFTNFDGKGNPGFAIPEKFRDKLKTYWKLNN